MNLIVLTLYIKVATVLSKIINKKRFQNKANQLKHPIKAKKN